MSLALAVASPSFSRHAVLCAETLAVFPSARFNMAGDRMAGKALTTFLAGADAAIIGLELVDDALLRDCPGLRLVAKYGVGLDNIDLEACARREVRVGWRAGVNAGAVAELVLALIIGFRRNLFREARNMASGIWNKDGGFGLAETTVGIVGLGHVGRALATLLRPHGTRVLGHDILDVSEWCEAAGIRSVSLDQLLTESDLVTLHLPLTPATRGMVDSHFLARMKQNAILVNTARGSIVDLDILLDALTSGRLAGAALDVFDIEPPTRAALLAHPNLVATPHIAGNSSEAVLAMGRAAIASMVGLADGDPGVAV